MTFSSGPSRNPKPHARGAGALVRRRLLAAAACTLTAAACVPQVEILVVRAAGLTGPVDHMKLHIVTQGDEEPAAYGPFNTSAMLDEQFVSVPPATPFYVDVMGCLGPTKDQCDEEVEFIARGCSGWETVKRDGPTLRLTVELQLGTVGKEGCPPEKDEGPEQTRVSPDDLG